MLTSEEDKKNYQTQIEKCGKAWEIAKQLYDLFKDDNWFEFAMMSGSIDGVVYQFVLGYWPYNNHDKTKEEKHTFLEEELKTVKKRIRKRLGNTKGIDFMLINMCAIQMTVAIRRQK